jgi:four helix bundle protein
VAVRRYEDLEAWKLADEVKRRVYDLVDTSTARLDFGFRDQLRASAASAAVNIAEGFAYYRHREFARHVRIARAEIIETQAHLADGIARGHWPAERAEPIQQLANRAKGATTGLLKYLTMTEAPTKWPEARRRR